jgi:UPF0271 protein
MAAKKRTVDVNCDMGEGLAMWRLGDADDASLMPLISSANIATGFHAGDPNLMDRTVELAVAHGVGIGAHPGFRDLHGFGRRFLSEGPEELVNDLIYQVGALREFAHRRGGRLQHVKPHGALYMHAARDEAFSSALVEALRKIGPDLHLYCMDVSVTYKMAKAAGHPAVREFYADRDYDRTGSIVFARRVGALDLKRVADKVARACLEGKVATVEGDAIDIEFESICFHSDTPGALDVGRTVRDALIGNSVRIARPGT